jgi:hypothetical protein
MTSITRNGIRSEGEAEGPIIGPPKIVLDASAYWKRRPRGDPAGEYVAVF